MNKKYIAHHGILGQKWGKRNGPPYPLDPEDHSSSEKQAGWRQSLKAKFTRELSEEQMKKREKQKESAFRQGKDGKPSNIEKIGHNTSQIIQDISSIKNIKKRNSEKKRIYDRQEKIKRMSDDELRKKINRKQMERQYRDLLRDEDSLYIGKSKLDNILDIAIPVASIAASSAAIAAAIYRIKAGF